MLRLALVLVLLAVPALAGAQDRVLVLHASADPHDLGHDLRRWVRAIQPQVADVAGAEALEDGSCWPEDAACAASLLRRAHAQRILLVRVLWERAGCAPIHSAAGARIGHRMLRTATLDLTLLDAQGQVLGHVTRPAAAADAAERRASALTLLTQLGLGP